MASYQSSFDPPSRPEPGWRPPTSGSRSRSGSRNQSSSMDKKGHRETDIVHLSGEMEMRRAAERSYIRTQLPKPGSRGPSPAPEISTATKPGSGFGFRRTNPSPTPVLPVAAPILKGKGSRNVLRRKQSSVTKQVLPNAKALDQYIPEPPASRASSARPSEDFSERTARLTEQDSFRNRQERKPSESDKARLPQIIPELDRYRSHTTVTTTVTSRATEMPFKISTHDLPPPTPLNSGLSGHSRYSGYSGNSAYSASPSTRFSESPGPGPYSRDTTPTSMSSQSPGIVAPALRMTPRLIQVQASPNKSRPPLTRRRTGSTPGEVEVTATDARGLPALRESSLTSSSSGSTVKKGGKDAKDGKEKEKRKKTKLSPSPPSPPPRKSSQKFKKTVDGDIVSPTKASKSPARPVMSSSSEVRSPKSTAVSPANTSRAPTRPSRENTPSLGPQFLESPVVIQSNMTSLPMSPERRRSSGAGSVDTNAEASSTSRVPVRGYSPNPSQPLYRLPTPAPAGLGIIPSLNPINTTSSSRNVSVSRSPSPSSSNSGRPRFGFFGKRSKTAPADVPTVDPKDKKKGPAAGTGHEGYGRYAKRGRSNSAVGRERSQSGASSSQESFNSHQAHDPFLLHRMSPVIIAGGGEIVENCNNSLELSRSESSQSLPALSRPSTESKGSFKSNLSKEVSRTTMWPSGLPTNPAINRKSISQSTLMSDSEASMSSSSLAIRRSVNRLDKENEKFRLPAPIMVPTGSASPAISSRDTSLRTDGTSRSSGSKADTRMAKKLTKRPSSPRKWNFFKRTPKEEKHTEIAVPVVVAPAPGKSVAHYAMLSSDEQEDEEPMDIENILREAEVVDLSRIITESPSSSMSNLNHRQHDPPSQSQKLTPDALPSLSIPFTSSLVEEQKVAADIPRTGRPSRLPQVGRIPKVVSARPEQTSPKSFSRPFARVSMIQPVPKLSVIDRQSIALGPSPDRSPSPKTRAEPEKPTQDQLNKTPEQQRAFLVISPRKDSVATTSSSSGRLSLTGITAIVPEPNAALEEDEVWDEYDDLIGAEDNKVPVSATSSHGVPFQYESYETRRMRKQPSKVTESPTVVNVPVFFDKPANSASKPPRLALTSSSVYSPDFSAGFKEAFQNLPTPSTPLSFGDFISGYGERNNSVTGSGGRQRSSFPSNKGSRPPSGHSKSASVSSPTGDPRLLTISELPKETASPDLNLRVGSMTVSKWLTFGHVLFSPARDDIATSDHPTKHHSILVIDGLGNDDWSFYAAETYPAATFYNLSPRAPRPALPSSPYMPSTPSNHRQVQHLNQLSKFPFPREFFAMVVVRFPAASPDALLKHLVSEAKRVLKPSGYLEMSILDFDMIHMGNRCRRAVRGLKEKLSVADPAISLASASDNVLREVGKKGFMDVKSCRVGVPVSSLVKGGMPEGEEVSLADMMRDESERGDESITKMVARVGRWWWTRCYESVTLADDNMNESILCDEKLLKECEKWGTSFKLLVCYAQKPVIGRRRTASV